jgi:hypothetical protein
VTDEPKNNLYWQTRSLAGESEDHLTYFLAAALEHDAVFRREYEKLVLESLSPATIERVATFFGFEGHSCVPDLLLELKGGRRVVCEHKFDAPETVLVMPETGERRKQLERYLELPVAAVAYFRPTLVQVSPEVIHHPSYIHPPEQTHFLWRDLYLPLSQGDHIITKWLFDGFRRQGFTPAVRHVGELWGRDRLCETEPGELRQALGPHERVREGLLGHRQGLSPRAPSTAARIGDIQASGNHSAGPGAALLRFRCEALPGHEIQVREIVDQVRSELPFTPEIGSGTLRNGLPYVDLLVSLHLLLSGTTTATEQEARLYAQVVPLLEALSEVPVG